MANNYISGFYEINRFINNAVNSTNQVGELSGIAKTYARDVKQTATVDGALNVFHYECTPPVSDSVLDDVYAEIALKVHNVFADYQLVTTINTYLSGLLGVDISDIAAGAMIHNPIDGFDYPEFISFNYTRGVKVWSITIWLANASFLAQYDKGQIEFIPPLNDMLMLRDNYIVAKQLARQLTASSINLRNNTQVGQVPLTGTEIFDVTMFNRNNANDTFVLPVSFAYNGGPLFCNREAFLKILLDFLIALGGDTSVWVDIIPDILPANKYLIVPTWDKVSINNLSLSYPIYSPIVDAAEFTSIANVFFGHLDTQFVSDNLRHTTVVYNSLGVFTVPLPDNVDGVKAWEVKFNDYFISLLGDVNLRQMSVLTQTMVILLDEIIRFAERYVHGVTVLPASIRVEYIDAKLFLTSRKNNVILSVISRESYLGVL